MSPESGVSAELEREISDGPTWTYPWPIEGIEVHMPLLVEMRGVVDGILQPVISDALAAAGPGASGIDIACNEGWYAQRMLDWGADRVVACDSRAFNVRRAAMMRDHFGLAPEQLELIESDLFALDPEKLGRFDVVALLGIIYHLENPVGAVRRARSLCQGICVIESQVIARGDSGEASGVNGAAADETAGFVIHRETDAETAMSPLAAMPGVISLIPNRSAIVSMALAAGFASAEVLDEPLAADGTPQRGDRAVVLARC